MQITRSTLDTVKGPDDRFTGDVYIDPVAAAPAPWMVVCALRQSGTWVLVNRFGLPVIL